MSRNQRTSVMTMQDLVAVSKELEGMRNLKFTEEGNHIYAIPKQLVREGVTKYSGLPELTVAEEFVGIPVTLEKDYTNWKIGNVKPVFRGVFNYDLNKHWIQNVLEFRNLVADAEWFNAQELEVQDALKSGKLFTHEDNQVQLKLKGYLLSEDKRKGDLLDHIRNYTVDLVFFADPTISYKLSENDERMNSTSFYFRVETEKEAQELDAEIGDVVETPWASFYPKYNAAFNNLYMYPLKDKFSNLSKDDFDKLPEVEAMNKKKLLSRPAYKAVLTMCRISCTNKDIIEVTPGAKIPYDLAKMQVSSNLFQRFFSHNADSDIHFEPSFAMMKMTVPKAELNTPRDYQKFYKEVKVNKPENTFLTSGTDDRVPTLHKEDQEWAKRFKETMLNFSFSEQYVKSNSFSKMKMSAIKEIIRQIALPMYAEIADGELSKDILNKFLKEFEIATDAELQNIMQVLAQSGGQFNGVPQGQQPVQPVQQQVQYQQQPQYVPNPAQPQYVPNPAPPVMTPQQPQQPQQQPVQFNPAPPEFPQQ